MTFSWCLSYLLFTLSSYIVRTVPPDYCLSPLNRNDCNMEPKIVFSYYKPGSRCERETWRGCPTANKFDNEYLCSLNCIFRMRQTYDAVNQCNIPLNQSICGELKTVVTHENGNCRRAWWGSCPTYNKFNNYHECAETCNGRIPKQEQYSYEERKEPSSIDIDIDEVKLLEVIDEERKEPSSINIDIDEVKPLEVIYEERKEPSSIDIDIDEVKTLEVINDLLKHIIEEEVTNTTEQETETKSTTDAVTDTDSVTESEEITTEAPEERTTEAPEEITTEAPEEITDNGGFDDVVAS